MVNSAASCLGFKGVRIDNLWKDDDVTCFMRGVYERALSLSFAPTPNTLHAMAKNVFSSSVHSFVGFRKLLVSNRTIFSRRLFRTTKVLISYTVILNLVRSMYKLLEENCKKREKRKRKRVYLSNCFQEVAVTFSSHLEICITTHEQN